MNALSRLPVAVSPPMLDAQARRRAWGAALGLALVVGLLFLRCLGNGFLNYDDPEYVTANPQVLSGLTPAGVTWAFTTSREYYWWHPLTWLGHMLNCQLWGVRAAGHHALSVGLHALNSALLFLLLQRLTGRQWLSLFAAAVFGLHPLRVETVAWVSELKDVLSCCGWLLACHGYRVYAARPTVAGYLGVATLFLLGLMAKPIVCVLPCALFLLDLWPLRRLEAWPEPGDRRAWCRRLALLVLEKLPLLALGAAVLLFAAHGARVAGAVVSMDSLPLLTRLAHAALTYWAYLGMILWPAGLAGFYTYNEQPSLLLAALATLALTLTTAAVLWQGRRRPWLMVGWLWYLGTLLPVIGLVQVSEQAAADRFTQIPTIGLLLILVAVTGKVADRYAARGSAPVTPAGGAPPPAPGTLYCDTGRGAGRCRAAIGGPPRTPVPSPVSSNGVDAKSRDTDAVPRHGIVAATPDALRAFSLVGAAVLILAVLAGLTWRQIGFWHDSTTFWRRVIAVNARPYSMAHYNLALALQQQGETTAAVGQYETAIRVRPNYMEAHNNLGDLFSRLGRADDALRHFREAVRLQPDYLPARNNLAVELAMHGYHEEAAAQFNAILRLNPEELTALLNLAKVAAAQRRFPQACEYDAQALAIARRRGDPDLIRSIEARVAADRAAAAAAPPAVPPATP